MFERYTEKARRIIFFARYEASQWGAEQIDTSHLLLALLREDKVLFMKLLGSAEPFDDTADQLGLKLIGEKGSSSVDLPLTAELKCVLAFAAEEAERLENQHITPGHLLLGLLRQPGVACNLLENSGLQVPGVRVTLLEMATTPEHRQITVLPGKDLSTNSQIIGQLRAQFGNLTAALKPEMEPAVVYRTGGEKAR